MKKFNFTRENLDAEFKTYKQSLVTEFAEQLGTEATVNLRQVSNCVVKEVSGRSFEELMFTLDLPKGLTKYSATVSLNSGYMTFVNQEHLKLYNTYLNLHTDLIAQYNTAGQEFKRLQREEQELLTAQKKAEAQYQRAKEKALQTFEEHTQRNTYKSEESDSFFYMLGWLAKHIGTISATIPDYLDEAFQKYFGVDAVHTTVDAKRKTVNGFAMQWSWSFKASLLKATTIPHNLLTYLNESQKAITNTSFIWDLISTWGFKFGKNQDVNAIKANVPANCLAAFNDGFAA